jgi:hypothetical protein
MAIAVVNDEDLASNERSINNLGFLHLRSHRANILPRSSGMPELKAV